MHDIFLVFHAFLDANMESVVKLLKGDLHAANGGHAAPSPCVSIWVETIFEEILSSIKQKPSTLPRQDRPPPSPAATKAWEDILPECLRQNRGNTRSASLKPQHRHCLDFEFDGWRTAPSGGQDLPGSHHWVDSDHDLPGSDKSRNHFHGGPSSHHDLHQEPASSHVQGLSEVSDSSLSKDQPSCDREEVSRRVSDTACLSSPVEPLSQASVCSKPRLSSLTTHEDPSTPSPVVLKIVAEIFPDGYHKRENTPRPSSQDHAAPSPSVSPSTGVSKGVENLFEEILSSIKQKSTLSHQNRPQPSPVVLKAWDDVFPVQSGYVPGNLAAPLEVNRSKHESNSEKFAEEGGSCVTSYVQQKTSATTHDLVNIHSIQDSAKLGPSAERKSVNEVLTSDAKLFGEAEDDASVIEEVYATVSSEHEGVNMQLSKVGPKARLHAALTYAASVQEERSSANPGRSTVPAGQYSVINQHCIEMDGRSSESLTSSSTHSLVECSTVENIPCPDTKFEGVSQQTSSAQSNHDGPTSIANKFEVDGMYISLTVPTLLRCVMNPSALSTEVILLNI